MSRSNRRNRHARAIVRPLMTEQSEYTRGMDTASLHADEWEASGMFPPDMPQASVLAASLFANMPQATALAAAFAQGYHDYMKLAYGITTRTRTWDGTTLESTNDNAPA